MIIEFDYLGIITMVKKLLLLISFISTTSLMASPATAQTADGGDDPKYIRKSLNLLPQHFFEVDFFNTPSVSETKFTMRLIVPGDVAGCAKIVEPFLSEAQKKKFDTMVAGVQKKYVGTSLKISVTRPELALDPEINAFAGTTRYSPYDCDLKHNTAYIDVELDHAELLKEKPEKMRLEVVSYNNETDFGEYKVQIHKDRFVLEGVSMEGPAWFTQWFFPKNTVILHTPQSKTGQDVHDSIREFGIAQGLTPMEDHFEKFELPNDAYNYDIFVDNSGYIANQIKSLDDNVVIGNIKATRTRFTASGETVETYELPVYARKPGKPE